MFFSILFSCTYAKIVYFQLNILKRKNSAFTYRNKSLTSDKLYTMKSSKSSPLNQVETYLQSLSQNNILLLEQVEFQFCSSIRFMF